MGAPRSAPGWRRPRGRRTGDRRFVDRRFDVGSEQPVDLEVSGPSPAGPESVGPDSTGPDPGAGAAAAQRVRTWLRGIRPRRADLKADAMAGLPGAISSVPDGMATAVLVGVNPRMASTPRSPARSAAA